MKKQINVPSIIFSRFNEDSSWKSKKFKELLDPTEGIRRGPFGSALKKELFVQNSEYVVYEQQNAIYDHFNTRYRISEEKYHELKKFMLLPDDFIMSGAGTIGKISLVPEGIEKGVFNQALIRLRVNKNTDKEFFLQWMRSPEMQNKLTKANPASAMVNLVPMSEVKEWDVIVPSFHEQSAIGSLFRNIDDLLASYKDNLINYQSLKATMLSKMFPKAGQTVPEIRLDGFEGEWEVVNLGTLIDNYDEIISGESGFPIATSSRKGLYLQNDYFEGGRTGIDLTLDFHRVPMGYATYRHMSDDSIFKFNKNNFETDVLVSKEYPVFISNGSSDIDFLLYHLNNSRLFLRFSTMQKLGGTRVRLYYKNLITYKLAVPTVKEQQAISAYFSNLDNLINSYQEKISQLEIFKKKLLQDMFI